MTDALTYAEPATIDAIVSESRALVVIDQGPNLAALAKSINHHINRALAADISGERHRVKAGQELIEARKHVARGEWIAWCKANIKRGQRDIQRLMQIAAAPTTRTRLLSESAPATVSARRRAERMRQSVAWSRSRSVALYKRNGR